MLIGISAVKLIDSEEIIVEIHGRAKKKLSLMYQVKLTRALAIGNCSYMPTGAQWSKQGRGEIKTTQRSA